MCVAGVLRGQKRALDHLELELQMVVSELSCGCRESNAGPAKAASALNH